MLPSTGGGSSGAPGVLVNVLVVVVVVVAAVAVVVVVILGPGFVVQSCFAELYPDDKSMQLDRHRSQF